MKKNLILITISMIVAGFFVWRYYSSPPQSEVKHEEGKKEEGIIRLDEEAIKSADIVVEEAGKREINNYITTTGEVKANTENEVYITPRIPGKVVEVKARLGDDVNNGEILARVDSVETEEIRAGFIGAAANLKAAEANLEKERLLYNNKAKVMDAVKKGIRSEEAITILKGAELGKAKADILKPLARLELGEANLKRERELLHDNISSMKEVIAAEKEYTSAMIEFQTGVEGMFFNAKKKLAKAEAEYMSAKARMEKRREEFYHYGFLDTEKEEMVDESGKYGHATIPIIAPFKGRIVERIVAVGQVVDISTKLFKLIDLSTVWVWANIYEKDLGMVKKGQEIFITVTPYPDRVFTGKITYISDTVDPATITVKVRAELQNFESLLKPEMFATVKILTGKGENLLAVPESAIQREGENTIVFVVRDENTFEKRVVSIGPEVGGYNQIISGLKEGERLVTKGAFTLKSESLKGLMEEE